LTLFIQAPTACINSLLFSVIEEFKCEEKNRKPANFLNFEKVGKEKLLAKILGKTEMLWLMTTNNHTIQSVLRNTIKFLIVRVSKH